MPRSGQVAFVFADREHKDALRSLDVFGVGAGAKMQQQLAHIAVAFAHTNVNFFQQMAFLRHRSFLLQ